MRIPRIFPATVAGDVAVGALGCAVVGVGATLDDRFAPSLAIGMGWAVVSSFRRNRLRRPNLRDMAPGGTARPPAPSAAERRLMLLRPR